ncbi:MAG: DinB family protein [Chloroflexota bacterium]
MTLTLLLDLDDTLLDTRMDAFIPAYFQALSEALADDVDPRAMLTALMDGTRCMMANQNPARSLRQVFDSVFFPALGIDRDCLQSRIETFYDNVFPSLGQLTRPRPGAVELVEWAFGQGHRVVIATNPLFPLKAIHHRMRWAGLPPEKYPFALVASYETFHFTKPSPAFYAEVLAQLGWPDDPVVMVGDDVENDLKPVSALGIPVFWIENPGASLPEGLTPAGRGRIGEVRAWVESLDLTACQPDLSRPEALLSVLRAIPAALSRLTHGLSETAWRCKPEPGEWCLVQLMCHLRDVENDVNLPRVRKILAEENPFIPGEVTDRWIEEREYAQQDGPLALAEFITARTETLGLLAALDAGSWLRPARHNIFGPSTLLELMGFVAEHDRSHIRQVLATIAAAAEIV